eukprot:CAMPEP_0206516488 /NCGR_PEP_ID=MMETSP0324_2-20121206/63402_1 /ASSEMBLY_ACC=CAM_ASM_000836 /TAXON_ID=2866 /ORGANISM="Crypthecodinium cohnii, Strain Seligo" /LENGTH=257 /DNA_ID=CAMNT_0054009441 /DNA_START=18 /DNA_END=791 /DNA_ORIENTATION=+
MGEEGSFVNINVNNVNNNNNNTNDKKSLATIDRVDQVDEVTRRSKHEENESRRRRTRKKKKKKKKKKEEKKKKKKKKKKEEKTTGKGRRVWCDEAWLSSWCRTANANGWVSNGQMRAMEEPEEHDPHTSGALIGIAASTNASQKDLLVASCSGQTTNCSVQQQWQQEGVRDSAEQCTRLQTDMQALERWPAPKISRRGSVRDIERRMSTIVPRLVGEALGPRHAIEGFRLGMDGGGQAVGQIGGKGRGNKGMLHGAA